MESLPRRQSVGLVALATALMAVSYLDRQVFAILSPTITRELGIGDATYGMLASAFSVAYLIAPPFAALLIDKIGVRWGLPLAVLIWSMVAATHAGAFSITSLFVLRFALGVAEAPSFPGAARVIHQSVSPAATARAFGFLFTGSSLGAIVAPPLATRLEAAFGWRFAFVGTALVGLLWIPVWWLASSRSPAREALDRRFERASTDRSKAGDVLRRPEVWRSIAAVVALSPLVAFPLLWGAKLFVDRFGVTPKEVGDLLWLPPLLYDVGAIAFGDLASRSRVRAQGGRRDGRALFAVASLLALTMGAALLVERPLYAAILLGVAMAGGGGMVSIHTSEVMLRLPRDLVGVAAGILATAQSLAYITSSSLIGYVVAGAGGYDAAIVGLTLWVIPGALVWLAWPASRTTIAGGEEAARSPNRIG